MSTENITTREDEELAHHARHRVVECSEQRHTGIMPQRGCVTPPGQGLGVARRAIAFDSASYADPVVEAGGVAHDDRDRSGLLDLVRRCRKSRGQVQCLVELRP